MTGFVFSKLPVQSDTGILPGDQPYVEVGNGPRALVVLPGFEDAMFSGTYPPFSGWALAPYFARYLEEYTVYLLSRPRGLPPGYSPDDAVATHARALEAIGESTVGTDVVGISMGGQIGQAIAWQEPDLIDRLVLANSGCCQSDHADKLADQFERYARDHDWASIRSKLTAAMFSDGRAIAYPILMQTAGRVVQPRPAVPSDVWRSLEFARDFDSRDYLGDIDHPTLVFGGERDPIITPDIARETVARLPNGELKLVPTAKHGAFHERKHTFDLIVRSFLNRGHE